MRNSFSRTAALAVVTAGSLVLSACGGSSSDDSASADSVKIGVVLPFTGVQATIAKLEGQGAEVAAKLINDAGGIDGKWKIDLVKVDDQLDPGRSATVMRDLNDKKVGLAIGGQTSDLCKSSAEASQRFNMTFIGAHCTSPDLVDPPITPNFFMVGQQMTDLATAIGTNLAKQYPDVETWDVLTYDVDAMRLSWDVAKKAMEKELGREVKEGRKYAVPVGATTMRKEISGLDAAGDKSKRGLFLGVYGAGTTSFIQQAKPTGLIDDYGVIAQTGVYWPTATALKGDAPAIFNVHDYFYACQDTEENDAFVAAFEKATGEKPDSGAYQSYVSMKLLEAAVTKAGSTDTADVQKALAGISIETPMGTTMKIGADTHHGSGGVTTSLLAGDDSAPQGVAITNCDVVPAS
ncbi:ABC transporter substrate-binding protein [Aeromicrobium wangtongii]|uniref:ABC transporter substrate-binding protein n=1 Tax=Aeromicrobium wangtongii TaxID=2969247 RepID=UPI0020174659|nr:ABC transporter substrate-binding protein [Aeromicrobium wangtongii]MCL3819845.1 ABC transporter substrate-binding protein [Aeromicrobium wangtongii]